VSLCVFVAPLQTTLECCLTIDNVSAATFTQTAKYANEEVQMNLHAVNLNDGYAWEMKVEQATENTSKSNLYFQWEKFGFLLMLEVLLVLTKLMIDNDRW
jgi:K+ transporter